MSFSLISLSNNHARFHKVFSALFSFFYWLECGLSWYGEEPFSVVWMIKAKSFRMAKPHNRGSLGPRHWGLRQVTLQTLDFTCCHYMLGPLDTAVCLICIPVGTNWMRGMSCVRTVHKVLVEVKWSEVTQSCLTLCDPVDCSPQGSSVHGIFQAIVLEWIAISFSSGSSQPRDGTHVSHIVGRCFYCMSHQGSP